MTIAYPLRIFFDCATAHLSPASRDHLGDQVQRSASRPESWIAQTPYGWFVWAEEEPGEDVPSDLAAIMRHARRHGAEYILFDADAPEAPDLPVFDWSD